MKQPDKWCFGLGVSPPQWSPEIGNNLFVRLASRVLNRFSCQVASFAFLALAVSFRATSPPLVSKLTKAPGTRPGHKWLPSRNSQIGGFSISHRTEISSHGVCVGYTFTFPRGSLAPEAQPTLASSHQRLREAGKLSACYIKQQKDTHCVTDVCWKEITSQPDFSPCCFFFCLPVSSFPSGGCQIAPALLPGLGRPSRRGTAGSWGRAGAAGRTGPWGTEPEPQAAKGCRAHCCGEELPRSTAALPVSSCPFQAP